MSKTNALQEIIFSLHHAHDVRPNWVDSGMPVCSEDSCPRYVGEHCGVMSRSPDRICEPAVRSMGERLSSIAVGPPEHGNLTEGSTLMDVLKECHKIACGLGWWPFDELEMAQERAPDLLASKIALIHSEVIEALEALRDSSQDTGGERQPDGTMTKPEGFASELADVVIRVFDLAGACEIDLEKVIAIKCEYNRSRPHRHGGKAL